MSSKTEELHVVLPRYHATPTAVSSAGAEAVDLAASAGLELDGWQRLVLEQSLGEQADGRWAARSVVLVVPRQNGKGSVLEARQLAGLFLFGSKMAIHSAHEFKTAAEAFRRILTLIESNPDLDAQVLRVTRSHGDEGIELRNRSRLRFMARSKGAGRGFSGDDVFIDEAYDFSDLALDAILPTLSARPNPQLWFTSSAPLDDDRSSVLKRFMKAGRAGTDPTLAYFEWCADVDDEIANERTWAKANPAFPHRISEESISQELSLQGAEGFRRERLGIIDLRDRTTASFLDVQAWDGLRDEDSSALDPVSFGFDCAPDRSWATIVAVGDRPDGLLHAEIVDRRQRTTWVVERCKKLHEKWGGPIVVAGGSPAAGMIGELAAAGIPVVEITNQENARACALLVDKMTNGEIAHRGDLPLRDAVANATPRSYGDLWLWSRKKSSGADISPLIAVTVALAAHTAPSEPEVPEVKAIIL